MIALDPNVDCCNGAKPKHFVSRFPRKPELAHARFLLDFSPVPKIVSEPPKGQIPMLKKRGKDDEKTVPGLEGQMPNRPGLFFFVRTSSARDGSGDLSFLSSNLERLLS